MRTTINLDDDVGRAARELARTSGKRLGKVVSELARRGLKARAELGRKAGFPIFRVGAEAEIIPADRARKLLEDDSL